jgi:hypothetical protein
MYAHFTPHDSIFAEPTPRRDGPQFGPQAGGGGASHPTVPGGVEILGDDGKTVLTGDDGAPVLGDF